MLLRQQLNALYTVTQYPQLPGVVDHARPNHRRLSLAGEKLSGCPISVDNGAALYTEYQIDYVKKSDQPQQVETMRGGFIQPDILGDFGNCPAGIVTVPEYFCSEL